MRRSAIALSCALAGALLGGCEGKNAALLVVRGDGVSVRKLEVLLRNRATARTDSVEAPFGAEAAEPFPLPATLSFAFPDTLLGWLEVCVDGLDGGELVARGEGFQAIARGDVTALDVTLEPAPPGTPRCAE